MDTGWLLWSSLFSLVGCAAFVYGRRQRRIAPTVVGSALAVYPYFVSDTAALVGIGVLLIVALILGNRYEDSL